MTDQIAYLMVHVSESSVSDTGSRLMLASASLTNTAFSTPCLTVSLPSVTLRTQAGISTRILTCTGFVVAQLAACIQKEAQLCTSKMGRNRQLLAATAHKLDMMQVV